MVSGMLINYILIALKVLGWLIIIDAFLTWIPSIDSRQPLIIGLRSITRPMLDTFRQLIPPEKTNGMDMSPLLAIIFLWILRIIIVVLVRS